MTDLTQPPLLCPAQAAAASALRGSLKGALALLALVLLGLLLWQLFAQYRHTQADLYQQSLRTNAELADHLTLNMALKAQQAANIVQPYANVTPPAALPPLLGTLRTRLPELRHLAWLDSAGRILGDSLTGSPDRRLIEDLVRLNQGRAHFFANSADNRIIYLLLRQPANPDRGYWLLRLSSDYYQQLTGHLNDKGRLWLLENSRNGEVLERLDLSNLPGQLDRYHLCNRAALKQSLALDASLRRSLLQTLKITEINQVARQLLNVQCPEGAWQRLIDGSGDSCDSIGMHLIDALIEQRSWLELEVRLPAPQGGELHLWLMARLPQQRRDYQAVILSISDITRRKQVALSLLERERFWSDVVRTVPDQLYVQDVQSQRIIFSNRHLGQTLGYERAELAQMGDRFWELCCTPKMPTTTASCASTRTIPAMASRCITSCASAIVMAAGAATRSANRSWPRTPTAWSPASSEWART